MTDFLVKCFVKDHDKTEDPQVRTRYGILASIVGICCNLLLFASKLFIGVLVNSVSVMADAFNNLIRCCIVHYRFYRCAYGRKTG